MVEVAIAVAGKVAEYLVAPIVRPLSYVWNYKTNLETLETEIRKLKGRRDEVKHSIDEARRNVEEIEQHVSNWLERVQTMTDELSESEVTEKNDRENMKCFDLKKRYQYSRKALKKVNDVSRLYEEGKFAKISYQVIPKETWIPSYKGYVSFESRISTLENILQALSNPNVNTVGIYGVGGIGKTTLAREVAAHAEDKKLFDVVAFAEVTVEPNIKEIQQEIADKLLLTFHGESTSGRARILKDRLKKETKVLLVLDNIWERLDLEKVGIPLGNDHKGSKMLLTARDLNVLSNKMDSRDNFLIDVLEKGEAWSLFKEKAGACIETDDRLQALAIDIANTCGGLPIAINSVAAALKGKEDFVWKNALQELTTPSPGNFEGSVAAETYKSIEISYNQLKGAELKSTFLLCSTMRRPSIEDLIAYGMGLGIFGSVTTIEEARNRVNTLIRTLKGSSLLLDIDNHKFSLHDVVRDLARSIASRDWHMLTLKDKVDMRELVCKEVFKNCSGISLHDISELVEELQCPQLQFLYMRTEKNRLQIPDKFFTSMPKLKVLHLVGLNLYSGYTSFHCLEKLKTLYVDYCTLGDIDFIGEIKQLEILRISCYESYKFSEKMRNLSALRLLDLNCHSNFDISPNVISTLTKLEGLYLCSTIDYTMWEVGVGILDELKYLSHLTALEISIRDANVLPKGRLLSRRLERYKIVIGDDFYDLLHGRGTSSSRMVKLNLSMYSCVDDVLHETPSVYKFLSGLDGVGFPDLDYLHLRDDSYFCTIVDCLESKSCDPFPSLESLVLDNVSNLAKICNSLLKTESFRRLREIRVQGCHNLKNIFTLCTYTALPLLQEVSVSECNNLEHIFVLEEEEQDVNKNEGIKKMIEFKQLRSVSLSSLPKLISFCSITNNEEEMLDTPSPLFNQKVAFSNLQRIVISRIDNLDMIWGNQLAKDSFSNLKSVEIWDCWSLKNIFPASIAKELSQLSQLTISECGQLVEIVAKEGVDIEAVTGFDFPRLTSLILFDLPQLRHFYPGAANWPALNKLRMFDCQEIGSLASEETNKEGQSNIPAFFFVKKGYFLNLEELYLGGEIFRLISQAHFSQHLIPKLKFLEVSDDKSAVFPPDILWRFLNLEKLRLEDSSYEELFSLEEVEKPDEKFAQIKSLELGQLRRLKHIWKQHSKLDFILQKLEILKVSYCGLADLLPSSASFQSLKILRVHYCHDLTSIFTSLTAQSLVQLTEMEISLCLMLTKVLARDEGDITKKKIIFHKLKSLTLDDLSRLTNFCIEEYDFEFPSLESLKVLNCSNMESFSPGCLSTPKLNRVGWTDSIWEGDINTLIQQMYEEQSNHIYVHMSPEYSSTASQIE